jgi:hypothetical protein
MRRRGRRWPPHTLTIHDAVMPDRNRERSMDTAVRDLFERYRRFFNRALTGDAEMDEGRSFYASAFIAASPAGVMAGMNDDQLHKIMEQGYARYRSIGTKEMLVRDLHLSPIDEHHGVAHVAWTAVYARPDAPDIRIDFDVHYLVQKLDGEPKIFGWVSGDERAVLKEHGVV